ncbi:MAG: hypothetical protein GOP50_07980 [Candidatus Heimdallarchaeota archaeon]|nr:hypothetical protein [Candidatus Heimdallarchaeota archaeon]
MISSKKLFCSLLLIIFLTFIKPSTAHGETNTAHFKQSVEEETFSQHPVKLNSLPPLPDSPFQINDDGDFSMYASNPGATGMEGDPFYIENKYINATDSDFGMSIANTTSYFVIRNCFIYDGWNGILVVNVSDSSGLAYNNTLYSPYCGIEIEQSPNFITYQNNFTDCSKGVYLTYTSGQIIMQNTFTSCYDGIVSNYASCGALDNTFVDCHYGASCTNNLGSYFVNNTILENQYQAFEMWNSTTYIFNNNISCTGSLITRIGNSIGGNFTNNYCFSNQGAEMYVYDSHAIAISNNNLYGCGFRIRDENITKLEIIRSLFEYNYVNDKVVVFRLNENSLSFSGEIGQIMLYNCTTINIFYATLVHTYSGIYLNNCNQTYIYNCEFENNLIDIKGEYCNYVYVDQCSSESSNSFLSLSYCYYGNISDCAVHQFVSAIFMAYTDLFHITRNHFVNGDSIAIMLEYCNHNLIYLNNFINNGMGFPQGWDRFFSEPTNFWYSIYHRKGNFWSDYSGSGYYEIFTDGGVGNFDKLPLNNPIVFIPEYGNLSLLVSLAIILSFISIVSLAKRRN